MASTELFSSFFARACSTGDPWMVVRWGGQGGGERGSGGGGESKNGSLGAKGSGDMRVCGLFVVWGILYRRSRAVDDHCRDSGSGG